jgi:hypothetical protein
MTRFGLLFVAALAAGLAAGQPAPPNGLSNWSFDELTLANGAKFQGLILSEAPDGIHFQSVSRLPGRPTVTLTSFFPKSEYVGVKRLSDSDRTILKERLTELDPSGEGERKRMESLELVSTDDWPGKPGAARRYDSDYFTLISTGSEELSRRSAVRLEQVYVAFARFLPPAVRDGRPTKVMLATDPDEYKALLGPLGEPKLLNPAVFDPQGNRVLCGSDLKRLGTELQTARIHHSQQLASLAKYEDTVRKLYKDPELKRYLEPIERERKRVIAADRANGAKFDQATARIFAILYHEAFHAYVGTFVYPPLKPDEVKAGKGTGELPRWLNEGLAQVFETAVVESGELRADWPDRDRLNRAKEWLKGKGGADRLVPLGDLLVIGRDAFLTSHTDQKAAADRAYLTTWSLAYYLTFGRRVIGTDAFRKYLVAVNSGGDPRQAFAALVGQDLPAFEKDWHAYLLRLQTDGTLGK